jgi:S-adenosylmethionine:tRNA-ribosyltransferase-isomerase (queuine synthetase)
VLLRTSVRVAEDGNRGPAVLRDAARLLAVNRMRSTSLRDASTGLTWLSNAWETVFNDTKVLPAVLAGAAVPWR